MARPSSMIVLVQVLLALGLFSFAVDARWKTPVDVYETVQDRRSIVDKPMNFSNGGYSRPVEEHRVKEPAVDFPLNFTNNGGISFSKPADEFPTNFTNNGGISFSNPVDDLPTNFSSGDIAAQEKAYSVAISAGPSFELTSKMPDKVQIRLNCINDNLQYPDVLVNQVLNPGDFYQYDLSVIDPNHFHAKYRCGIEWLGLYPNTRMDREVWADKDHQNLMPFYCVSCSFTVDKNGLYLFNLGQQVNVFLEPWDY